MRHPKAPKDPTTPDRAPDGARDDEAPGGAGASRSLRLWLLALVVPIFALFAMVGGHAVEERSIARALDFQGPAPMASIARHPAHAWDTMATDGDDLGAGEPWARDPDGLHAVPSRTCPPLGDCVIDFPYHDEVLLAEHQGNSGRVWIPEAAREAGGRFPVVVLLHGLASGEESEPPHKLLSPPVDLSAIVRRHLEERRLPPVLVAAPSQTREAWSSATLWTADGFDLSGFLEALDRELVETSGVRLRRDHVSVLGHSGAGCVLLPHKKNGLFRVAEQLPDLEREGIRVRLLGLMDVCFYGAGGGEFLARQTEATQTRVFAMWVEPERWPWLDRDLDGFAKALGAIRPVPCPAVRYEECLAAPDGSRVYKAREEGLKLAFGAPPETAQIGQPRRAATSPQEGPSPQDGLPPHDALTRWFVDEALGLYFAGSERSARPSAPAARPRRRVSSPCGGSGSPSPAG